MTKDNFWILAGDGLESWMESCRKVEAEYVSIELYDKLLQEHAEVLEENANLADIIEDSGVDVNEILEAKRTDNDH